LQSKRSLHKLPRNAPREILSFEDTQQGQTLYIALSWENEKGRLGPPSPIQSRVIS
jgi:hypothetical protein